MTNKLHFACALIFAAIGMEALAQGTDTNTTLVAAEHAKVMKLSYDAAHLAHALQYHQARTMLAGIGGYTRYEHAERITENNWFNSQIEELELQLPRMRQKAERIQVSEQDRIQLDTLFRELDDLLNASREVHKAIKDGNLEFANHLYIEIVDEPYNDAIAAAHTLISNSDRSITMIRLKIR